MTTPQFLGTGALLLAVAFIYTLFTSVHTIGERVMSGLITIVLIGYGLISITTKKDDTLH